MDDKKIIYYYNKITKLVEKGMLKNIKKELFFLTNNRDFDGASPENSKEMEGFKYSWYLGLGIDIKNLSTFKSIKEFEKITGVDFNYAGIKSEKRIYCNFKFLNEVKTKFEEIKL